MRVLCNSIIAGKLLASQISEKNLVLTLITQKNLKLNFTIKAIQQDMLTLSIKFPSPESISTTQVLDRIKVTLLQQLEAIDQFNNTVILPPLTEA